LGDFPQKVLYSERMGLEEGKEMENERKKEAPLPLSIPKRIIHGCVYSD